MYHSISFGTEGVYTAEEANLLGRSELAGMLKGYNTWYDWHLIPASRPTIEHPQITTSFIKIPGRHGTIDLTNYICDYPIMADRTGSFEFIAVEGYDDFRLMRIKMVEILHGRKMKMSFEDDPWHYYVGRFSIKSWKNENIGPSITIDYQTEPYKYRVSTTSGVPDEKILDGDL